LKDLPLSLFHSVAAELGNNFIDSSQKAVVVNLTWVQNFVAKML
jgi:hypothetical protein